MMHELEKLSAGEWISMNAPSLARLKSRARTLCEALGRSSEAEPEHRRMILEELLGSVGEGVTVKPPLYCDYGCNIHLGDRALLNFDCVILDAAPVRIGADTLIGPQVGIYTVEHPIDPEHRKNGDIRGLPVTIGENVWIGGGAKILPGVTIGDGAVIGAGSVVTKDIPPYALAVGNPARVVRACKEDPNHESH